jgi:hypothetical protein
MSTGKLGLLGRGVAVATAGLLVACQAIATAPTDVQITLVVNPQFVPAHGGVAVASALLIESIGTPVADGTVVQFFTNLGRIEEQGRTNDGVARVNFVSDARSGTATITAAAGGQTATAEVRVGGAIPPDLVVVTAAPRRITDSRSSQISALVLDADGNPVPNVAVFFTVDGPTEHMDSMGQPVFTDNDGRARDVLRTRYPRDGAPVVVTVTAQTANGVEGEIDVIIN